MFTTPLKDTLEEFKSYLENQVSYNKLLLTKSMSEFTSYIMLMLTIIGISGFVLFFLLIAFAHWFGDVTGLGDDVGYLVVAGIYMLIGLFIFIFRETLIFKPIRQFFGSIFFGSNNPDNDPDSFKSMKHLNHDIHKAQKDLSDQRERLSQKINDLGNAYSITNIAHQVVGTAYNQFANTSKMINLALKMFKSFRKFAKKRIKKRINKENYKKINKEHS